MRFTKRYFRFYLKFMFNSFLFSLLILNIINKGLLYCFALLLLCFCFVVKPCVEGSSCIWISPKSPNFRKSEFTLFLLQCFPFWLRAISTIALSKAWVSTSAVCAVTHLYPWCRWRCEIRPLLRRSTSRTTRRCCWKTKPVTTTTLRNLRVPATPVHIALCRINHVSPPASPCYHVMSNHLLDLLAKLVGQLEWYNFFLNFRLWLNLSIN